MTLLSVMSSLNSKRRGGFSRAKGSSNLGNSRNQPNFGGKKTEGFVAKQIPRSTKK